MYITCVPAYGKDYKSGKEVKAAWEEGKDFQIQDVSCKDNGRYVNKNDKVKGITFNIRYKKLTQIVMIKGKKLKKYPQPFL